MQMNNLDIKKQPQAHIKQLYRISPITPRSGQNKMFQRKQQQNHPQRKISRLKKIKEREEEKVCFVPSFMKTSDIYKLFRSKSNTNFKLQNESETQQFSRKSRVLSNEPRSISPFKKNDKADPENNFLQAVKLKQETFIKEQILRQKRQILELRQKNQTLIKQVRAVKYQNTIQVKNVESLNERVKVLSQNAREFRKKVQQKNQEIKKLKKIIQDQSSMINKLDEAVTKKQYEIRQLLNEKNEKQELQKMLSEMNKNFDDIFVENRTPDMESIVGNSRLDLQFDSDHMIHNLQQKIKYQQIEIGMLKKYKFQVQRFEKQLQKQKMQNKLLMSKIRTLPANGQKLKEKKNSFEESISFQLSKDQINHL